MVKEDISVSEFRKKYPTLFISAKIIASDSCGRRGKVNMKYLIEGVDRTKFMLAEKFLLSIKNKKVREIAKKYGLSKTIPSMVDYPNDNALEEFVCGEEGFSSGITKKSKGAKEADRILGKIFSVDGKWFNIIDYSI